MNPSSARAPSTAPVPVPSGAPEPVPSAAPKPVPSSVPEMSPTVFPGDPTAAPVFSPAWLTERHDETDWRREERHALPPDFFPSGTHQEPAQTVPELALCGQAVTVVDIDDTDQDYVANHPRGPAETAPRESPLGGAAPPSAICRRRHRRRRRRLRRVARVASFGYG